MEYAGFRLLLFASLFLLNNAFDVLYKDRFVQAGDNPCKYLPDGVYPMRDVFKFVSCKKHISTVHKCPSNQIYVPGHDKCVDASTQTEKTFCQNRTNGDWSNPWNCHTLYKCLGHVTYPIPCQLATLVYNPDNDQCVYPGARKCEQLPNEHSVTRVVVESSSPCDGKKDGKYEIPDVFRYLACKGGKASLEECDVNEIYEPGNGRCVSILTQSILRFCENRTDGDFRNPWACHRYLSCSTGVTVNKPCALDFLVYNPDVDHCVPDYPCNQVGEDKQDDNPCAVLKDGNYPIRDVFKYITCKDKKTTYNDCEEKQIFEPGVLDCVDASTQTPKDFCQNRTNGDWSDPWNCHKFFKCFYQQAYAYDCQTAELVYNPSTDACVYPKQYECKQLPQLEIRSRSTVAADDFCKGRSDGNYALPDVFSYITCTKEKSVRKYCEKPNIFSQSSGKCMEAGTLVGFCRDRTDGDWRNPWNCYSAINCDSKRSKVIPCLINGFVFDPDHDVCKKSFPCDKLPTAVKRSQPDPELNCNEKPDGFYSIRDVMGYLRCAKHVASVLLCKKGYVFEKLLGRCVNATRVAAESFCIQQPDGNYRNPWDCHGYIACVNGRSRERKCVVDSLVYNPYNDNCEYESPEWQCVQFSPQKPNLFPPFQDNDFCKDPDTHVPYDNKKLIVTNPFQYIRCTKGVATLITCKGNRIFIAALMDCANPNNASHFRDQNSFCEDRKKIGYLPYKIPPYKKTSGFYLDAWKCDQYLACLGTLSVPLACQPTLNYNVCTEKCGHNVSCRVITRDVLNIRHNVQKKCVPPTQPQLPPPHAPQIKDICTTLDNGLYAIRNVLQYLKCDNHTSKVVGCPKGTVYVPGGSNCTNASKITKDNFCKSRSEGNWLNPWDCHTYLVCRKEHPVQVTKCNLFVTLNYDPVQDVCDYPSAVPCIQIAKSSVDVVKTAVLTEVKDIAAGDFCKGKKDGKYPIPDVFGYTQCKNGKSTPRNCSNDNIFSELKNDCVAIATQSFYTFCRGRDTNVDWRNPWDCTSYIVCSSGSSRKRKCLINGFVFDPTRDLCVKSSVLTCRQVGTASQDEPKKTKKVQVSASRISTIFAVPSYPFEIHQVDVKAVLKKATEIVVAPRVKDICTYLDDGIYGIRNVLQYLECKDHSSVFHSCVKGTIYVSGKNCTNATKYNEENFCIGRGEGNWANPWDCHTYFSCHASKTFKRVCNNFVTLNYDAVLDVCEYPSQQKCVQLAAPKKETLVARKSAVSAADPCVKLSNGYHAERDVTKYFYCYKGHAIHYGQCGTGAIFLPGVNRCKSIKNVDPERFCVNRTDGNFQNPWNCHRYFTCHVERTFDRPCSNMTILNYNPKLNLCSFPYQYKCVNITAPKKETLVARKSAISAADPCVKLPDGYYTERDVTKYFYCHNGHAHYGQCRTGAIFLPGVNRCNSIKNVDPERFCVNRTDGNFQNPWNCHRYFTCHVERTFDRPCSNMTILNYNPKLNLCSFPYQYKCVNISDSLETSRQTPALKQRGINASPCADLDNGKYPMRDVFMYMQCDNHVGTIKSCKTGTYFDVLKKDCIHSESKVDATSFCRGRDTGNWGNPWNCHHYITCTALKGFDRPCSLVAKLIYNPHENLCEYPGKHICKQLPSIDSKSTTSIEEILPNDRIIL